MWDIVIVIALASFIVIVPSVICLIGMRVENGFYGD